MRKSDKAEKKKILCIPLDPVHDFGLRMIKKKLDDAGHHTALLPPDLSIEEISEQISRMPYFDFILVSRTIGYGSAEILANFLDILDALKIREKTQIAVGGMGISKELAAEIGFDAGFDASTTPEQALAYIEGREYVEGPSFLGQERNGRTKRDLCQGFSYAVKDKLIDTLLEDIADQVLTWSKNKTTPGIERAKIREEMFSLTDENLAGQDRYRQLEKRYIALCDSSIQRAYMNSDFPPRIRKIPGTLASGLKEFVNRFRENASCRKPFGEKSAALLFAQIGSGSPIMDTAHIKVCEAMGIDGIITICPSSGARNEGLLKGLLNHEGDGTLLTVQNLVLIKQHLDKAVLWLVRAHRGLNGPEAVLYAGHLGADLSKLNFFYGSLGAGTDPARLIVDTIASLRYAASYNIAFDIPSNDELCGIPTYKSFAGLLVMAKISRKLQAKPILKPLFCYSPYIIFSGKMSDNFVDFNAAKIKALRSLINSPIWIGEPAGFMTHTEDRIQSAMTTALHIELACNLGVQAVTMASTDEAYSRGVINLNPRLDTMKGAEAVFRFMGKCRIEPTGAADILADELMKDIKSVLTRARDRKDLAQSIYEGTFGGKEDGVSPGRGGRGTLSEWI